MTVVERESFILTLTKEEAHTLQMVCNRIGGDPNTSRRGHMDSINKALGDVAVFGGIYDNTEISKLYRNIFFLKKEQENG